MKTYYIQAEIVTVTLPDGEVDVDIDVYAIEADSPENALETLRALKNYRGEFMASGVHQAEVVGCTEDAEADFMS